MLIKINTNTREKSGILRNCVNIAAGISSRKMAQCGTVARVRLASILALCALTPVLAGEASLKDVFQKHFLVGVALNNTHVSGKDSEARVLVTSQFNSLTPENAMKWESLHLSEGKYDFTNADHYVEFGEKHGLAVIGHTLVWHNQTPAWVFKNADGSTANRETLLARMCEHIHTVVGRYKGRVKGWDVVNEALAGDGSLRDSQWRKIIGDDYILKAFQFAHEADPDAELYYNDYSIENPAKRKGAVALLQRLKDAGISVFGVGIQEHVSLTWPNISDLDKTITAFGKLGLKVMITELDVDVLPSRNDNTGSAEITKNESADSVLNPYSKGLPDEMQQKLAHRYAKLFGVYLKHHGIVTRVTFWGVSDDNSWLNDWPIKGRTSYPLLFDRAGKPKPAFYAVMETARSKNLTVGRSSQKSP